MSATSPRSSSGRAPTGAPGLERCARRQGQLGSASRRSASRSPSARAPMPSWCRERHRRSGSTALQGAADPRRRRGRRSPATTARPPTTRPTSCCSISALATVSIVVLIALRDRLARGAGHAGRHPDHDPADAVRRQPDGLHHQPRQPVRADLLDRHPGRRRHRRGREHRPPLGDERRPRRACRPRSRRSPRSAIRPSSRR